MRPDSGRVKDPIYIYISDGLRSLASSGAQESRTKRGVLGQIPQELGMIRFHSYDNEA